MTARRAEVPNLLALKTDTYHVVFVDIVKYSRRRSPDQGILVMNLFKLIKSVVKTLHLRPHYLPTGDGAAVCLPCHRARPAQALAFLTSLMSKLKRWNEAALADCDEGVAEEFHLHGWSETTNAYTLHIAVNVGPLCLVRDLTGRKNVAGDTINETARLLTFSGPNQAVFSYEAMKHAGHGTPRGVRFRKIPEKTVKGVRYQGYQLTGPDGIDPTAIAKSRAAQDGAEGLDGLPHHWIRTNHSSPLVEWVAADKEKYDSVRDICETYYGSYVSTPSEIEQAPHVAGSDVYRVPDKEGRHPILVRVFRYGRSPDNLANLCAIQKRIAAEGVFEPYGECLVPLLTSVGEDWVQPWEKGAPCAMATRFLKGARTGDVTHFAGNSPQEIKSVAGRLGHVNAVLIDADVAATSHTHKWDMTRWRDFVARLKKVGSAALPKRTTYLASGELPLIERTLKEIRRLPPGYNRYLPTFGDCHPHNVFVLKAKCLLIFDYDDVRRDVPEAATCAFALHRLCREYVRGLRGNAHFGPKELVRDAADAFLDGYREHRPKAIQAIRTEGIRWAKAINFASLMSCIAYGSGWEEDERKRGEPFHFQEVVKFLSYLKELDIFDSVVSAKSKR